MKPAQQRDRVGYLKEVHKISVQRACALIGLASSTYYFKPSINPENAALTTRITQIDQVRVRYGYPRIHVLLRREGFKVSRKRVYRLYRLQGLNLRSKMPHRRRAVVPREMRLIASRPNEIWAMDFMHERLANGNNQAIDDRRPLFSRVRGP